MKISKELQARIDLLKLMHQNERYMAKYWDERESGDLASKCYSEAIIIQRCINILTDENEFTTWRKIMKPIADEMMQSEEK